eukprot:scaffold4462_cov119-Skeletonema_dohrnii-CCMP3373.AAC.8
MGRKRNQGKARKAAKAKAREEAEEERNHTTTDGQQLSLPALLQQLQSGADCVHGLELMMDNLCAGFVDAFIKCFQRGSNGVMKRLKLAEDATMDKFADVWNDSAKMEIAMSFFLCCGTQGVLHGSYADARRSAVITRYFEQHVAIKLHQTQALICFPKFEEMSDEHSLVKFYRRRIPCSCLDEKYEEVKSIPKMAICYNLQCPNSYGEVERSKTMYCSRCRSVTYCSRECQKADWAEHKPVCGDMVARKAAFDANKRSIDSAP